MAKVTIAYGIWLLLIGVASYFFAPQVTGNADVSPTALIPAGAGVFLVLLGIFARMEGVIRAIASHLAILMALALACVTAPGIGQFIAIVQGYPQEQITLAPLAKLLVALSSFAYLYLAVRSFVNARRDRKEAGRAPVRTGPGRPNIPQRTNATDRERERERSQAKP